MFTILRNKWTCLRAAKMDVNSLEYQHQNLEDIPPEVFVHERTLYSLCLNSNHIKILPRELFLCMNLRSLSVADNELTFLPPLIKTLSQLSHLDISKNCISDVSDDIKFCLNITILNVSANPLERLPGDISPLKNLVELYLNNTFLKQLPIMAGLTMLKVVELRENQLQELPLSFSELRAVEKLDLGGNKLSRWPEALQYLTNLEELWLNNNKIATVPKEIKQLTNLSFLDLSENLLSVLPEDVGNCSSLTDLYLSFNRISELPETICQLKKLNKLKLDNNCLSKLPQSIGSLVQLHELDASSNNLETLPQGICLLKNLGALWLDDNFITYLPNELCSCAGLTILSVRSNNLEELPENLGRLRRLKVLNLVDNKIMYLPYSIHLLKELRAIWIIENQVRPVLRLYPSVAKSGLKVLVCNLLPQSSEHYNDGIEWQSVKEHLSKFVSFDGTALQTRHHRICTSYPKEMKTAWKNRVRTFQVESRDDLRREPPGGGNRPSDLVSDDGLLPPTINVNAHGDQDMWGSVQVANSHISLPLRGILKADGCNEGIIDHVEEICEEIDVDQPIVGGNEIDLSTMTYKEFRRNMVEHGIPLPKRRHVHPHLSPHHYRGHSSQDLNGDLRHHQDFGQDGMDVPKRRDNRSLREMPAHLPDKTDKIWRRNRQIYF